MNRRFLSFSIGLSLLLPGSTFAQAFVPQQRIPKIKLDRVERDLQIELERVFGQIAGELQPNGRRADADALRWGGVQLKKVTPELQQKLGLPENEGMAVAAVDANSAGARAGLKVNDILVKINGKAAPGDVNGFSKLVQDQKPNEAMELVVLRDGKEETIKNAMMPGTLALPNPFNGRGGAGIGGIGGAGGGGIGGAGGGIGGAGRPGLPGQPGGIQFPRINPIQPAVIKKLHVEMEFDGGTLIRKQDGDQFSGEFTKGDLKITVTGKIENRQVKPGEIVVTQGKESSKYANLRDVPAQHQRFVQQLLPSPLQNMMLFPSLPIMPEFPPEFFPGLPEFQK